MTSRPLTRLERLLVVQYRQFHQRPPTQLGMLLTWQWLRTIALVAVLAAMLVWVLQRLGPIGDVFLPLNIGVFVGALLNRIAMQIRFVQIWPFLEAVIDWNTVERLAEQGVPDKTPQSPFQVPDRPTSNPYRSPGA